MEGSAPALKRSTATSVTPLAAAKKRAVLPFSYSVFNVNCIQYIDVNKITDPLLKRFAYEY